MRRCLLKGCEQRFHPRQARQRYCSEELPGSGAEMVALEGAAEDTGRPAAGKQKRNGQSQRYRAARQKPETSQSQRQLRGREGNHYRTFFSTIRATGRAATRDSCVQRRSPLQRFCSHDCRRALERVQERERRWKQARDLIRRY